MCTTATGCRRNRAEGDLGQAAGPAGARLWPRRPTQGEKQRTGSSHRACVPWFEDCRSLQKTEGRSARRTIEIGWLSCPVPRFRHIIVARKGRSHEPAANLFASSLHVARRELHRGQAGSDSSSNGIRRPKEGAAAAASGDCCAAARGAVRSAQGADTTSGDGCAKARRPAATSSDCAAKARDADRDAQSENATSGDGRAKARDAAWCAQGACATSGDCGGPEEAASGRHRETCGASPSASSAQRAFGAADAREP